MYESEIKDHNVIVLLIFFLMNHNVIDMDSEENANVSEHYQYISFSIKTILFRRNPYS